MTTLWMFILVICSGGEGVDTLDLPTYLELWKARSPDLRISEQAVSGAQGDASSLGASAGWSLSGTFGYAPREIPIPASDISDKMYTASLSDNGAIWDALTFQKSHRVEEGEAGIRSARSSASDTRRLSLGNAIILWVQAVAARRGREFAEMTDSANAGTERLVEIRVGDGAASEADLLRARTAHLESIQALSQSVQSEAASLESLRVFAGLDSAVAVPDTMRDPRPNLPEDTTLPGLLGFARDHRPDLLAAQAAIEQDRMAVSSAHDQWIPSVQLAGGVQQMGDGPLAVQPRTWTITATLGLPGIDHASGVSAKATANLRTQEIALGRLREQVDADVRSGWTAWSHAMDRNHRSGGDLLPSAKRARDLVALQYAKGSATLLDLLDADRALVAARSESVQAEIDLWTASVQIEQALGKDVP